jgi:hypothetical protein
MLLNGILQRKTEHFRWARLAEKLENVSSIDSIHSRLLVGIAGEHDPHRVGCELLCFAEELDAIHDRHSHVRNYNGERVTGTQQRQTFLARRNGSDIKASTEVPPVRFQYV